MQNINYTSIIGADEAGTGACAGPAAICAVKAPKNWTMAGLNDSKKLSENQRLILEKQLLALIKRQEIEYCLILKSNQEIDQFGLAACLDQAFTTVIQKIYQPNIEVIIDGKRQVKNLSQVVGNNISYVIRADSKYPQVMAASILAKCARDRVILDLDKLHPEYQWESNRGYLRPDHIAALKKYGFSPFHRTSYKIKGVNK